MLSSERAETGDLGVNLADRLRGGAGGEGGKAERAKHFGSFLWLNGDLGEVPDIRLKTK